MDHPTSSGDPPSATRRRFVATLLGVVAGVIASLGTIAVSTAGFSLSFDAIRAVGAAAHLRPSLTWLLPVCVDGAMSVSAVCAVVLKRMGRNNLYPWSVVVVGAAISIVANALHAYQRGGEVPLPVEWAMAASAVPALLLALSVHLVVILAEAVRQLGQPEVEPHDAVTSDNPLTANLSATQAQGVTGAPPTTRKAAARVRRRAGKASTADRVARTVSRSPTLTTAQVAAKLRVSERTVQRNWPATVAASPNGSQPQPPGDPR